MVWCRKLGTELITKKELQICLDCIFEGGTPGECTIEEYKDYKED